MSIREEIQKKIAEALPELGLEAGDVFVEHPTDVKMGDYSTNVAMVKAKEQKTNPRELAEKIQAALEGKIAFVEKIEVAGPGFINFFLANEYFTNVIGEVLGNKDYGKNNSLKEAKIMVEYTDPNPFKQFHIGHLMSNAIGESISRLYEWNGAEVKRANYQGDVGLHVAKAIWGMMQKKNEMPAEGASSSEAAAYIGEAYVFGSNAYEDDPKSKKEIDELNTTIFLKNNEEVNNLYNWGRKVSLDHFEEIYAKLGTKFDYYFFEDEVANRGIDIVNNGLEKGIFEKSDGATVFKGGNYDPSLHTRVFINSKGLPTYEAKELALIEEKQAMFPFDASVSITASEQNDYFKVVMKALELLNPELRKKVLHISHGMLRFATGKMSSRKGNIITGESLILAMQELAFDKMNERELTNEEKNIISEQVGIAAIKYSILKQTPGRDIIYDFDKSLSFEGDSGPYLQYAAVRAQSVLEKAAKEGIEKFLDKPDETAPSVAKLIARFPEIVLFAQHNLSPNHIATYLIELSSSFNNFYAENKIVDKKDEYSPYRVALTEAFVNVMQSGLYLLGIKVPEKM